MQPDNCRPSPSSPRDRAGRRVVDSDFSLGNGRAGGVRHIALNVAGRLCCCEACELKTRNKIESRREKRDVMYVPPRAESLSFMRRERTLWKNLRLILLKVNYR